MTFTFIYVVTLTNSLNSFVLLCILSSVLSFQPEGYPLAYPIGPLVENSTFIYLGMY